MPIIVSPQASSPDGAGTPGATLHAGQLLLGEITLGVTDSDGVEWFLESLEGWDAPASTGSVEQRSADHGGWLSPAYYAPRSIAITGSLVAASWDAASRALDRLFAAIPLSTLDTLYVAETERTLQADVRQDGDPLTQRAGGWAQFSLSLVAPDPRRYSTDTVTASTGLPQSSGGLQITDSLSITDSLTIAETVDSGFLTVSNVGNFETSPTLTVQGPCPAFTITHQTSGKVLRSASALPAGRTVTLDTDKRRALLDDGSLWLVTGAWFRYQPGDNTVAFSASTYDSGAKLTSSHRSAWR